MSVRGATGDPVVVDLRNGRRVTIRSIDVGDADRLQDAIRALSMDSRYSRFFSPLRELPPELLERATHPAPGRELQLVAIAREGQEEKIVGGVRYVALEASGDCEFAVAIVDEWHGLGLARLLLETLIDRARAAGFRRMEGHVLATNVPMLTLAKRIGFAESASSEGPTVRLVRRDLSGA